MRLLAGSLALLLLVLIAGCGGGGSGEDRGGGAGGKQTVHVAVTPSADFAPLYLARKQGFFAKRGLEVKLKPLTGSSSELIPALVRGDIQFLTGTPTLFFPYRAHGLPLQFVANVDTVAASTPPAMVAGPNSGLRSVKDAAGKTFCVESAGGGSQLTIESWAGSAGVDPHQLHFTVSPFAGMVEAIQQGRCDAALLVEPFYDEGIGRGFRPVGNPFFQAFGGKGVPIGIVMGAQPWVAKNPQATAAFQAGLAEGIRYAAAHPAAARAILPSYTGATAAAARHTRLPIYQRELHVRKLQAMADASHRYGYSPKRVDVKEMLAAGAPHVDR